MQRDIRESRKATLADHLSEVDKMKSAGIQGDGIRRLAIVLTACLAIILYAAFPAGCEEEKVTIEFWSVWGRIPQFRSVVKPFEEENPNIQVDIEAVPQGLPLIEKMTLRVVAGTPPDVVLIAAPATEFLMQDLFVPLDQLIEASDVVNPEDFIPRTFEPFNYKGKQYAIPGAEHGPSSALIYNKRLFNEAGLPGRPETLQELLLYHRKLTRKENDTVQQIGFNPIDAMGGRYFADIWPPIFDFEIYDEETRTLRINTPEMRKVFEYLSSLYEYMSVSESWKFGGWTGALASGHVAMQLNGYWVPGELRVMEAKDEFEYTWFPNVWNDKLMAVVGWGMAIPKGCRHVKEAFKFIEYMSSTEACQRLLDYVGFLNGNVAAIRELDWSGTPGIEFFLRSASEADRFAVAEKIPITTFMRSTFSSRFEQVAGREVALTEALTRYAHECQVKMEELFK